MTDCPLVGLPPVERAWTAKRGDTVFLRLPGQTNRLAYDEARAMLDRVQKETGVFFVLLAAGVEVVAPTGEAR